MTTAGTMMLSAAVMMTAAAETPMVLLVARARPLVLELARALAASVRSRQLLPRWLVAS
jgi:hypothetical protein